MTFCPKCGYEQKCGCDSCKPKLPEGIKPYVWDETGELISCVNCGFTAHADWWLTLEGDVYGLDDVCDLNRNYLDVCIVGICSYDSDDVRYVCLSYETALKRWNELRLELIEWFEYCSKENDYDNMYKNMIKNLQETDPNKLNNEYHDEPYIRRMELEK